MRLLFVCCGVSPPQVCLNMLEQSKNVFLRIVQKLHLPVTNLAV